MLIIIEDPVKKITDHLNAMYDAIEYYKNYIYSKNRIILVFERIFGRDHQKQLQELVNIQNKLIEVIDRIEHTQDEIEELNLKKKEYDYFVPRQLAEKYKNYLESNISKAEQLKNQFDSLLSEYNIEQTN